MKKLLLLVLLLPSAAAAQDRPRNGEAPALSLRTAYSARDGFENHSEGASASFGLGRLGDYGFTAATEFVRHDLHADGWLPDSLYNTGFKASAAGPKWVFAGGLRSNSDRPYASAAEIDFYGDATTTLKRNGPHSLIFGFNYSSRRSFFRGVPLPYITYRYSTEKLDFFFPFSLRWRAGELYEVSATYIPPRYFEAAVSRRISQKVKLRLEGGLSMSQYLPAGRADKDMFLFIEQPFSSLRAEITASKSLSILASAGYGFKGRYFSGRRYDEHRDKVNFGGGPIFGLVIRRPF